MGHGTYMPARKRDPILRPNVACRNRRPHSQFNNGDLYHANHQQQRLANIHYYHYNPLRLAETNMKNCLVVVGLVLAFATMARTTDPIMDDIRDDAQIPESLITHDINFTGSPIAALEEVLRGTAIPGGVVQQSSGCSLDSPIRLKAERGTTVGQAMDALAATNSTYDWMIKDNVIDLIPKAGAPALLDTVVLSFHMNIPDQWAPSAVLHHLTRTPEVMRRVEALRLKEGLYSGGPGAVELNPAPRTPRAITIDAKNISLLEAFNSVARSYGHTIWVYTELTCKGGRTYTVEAWSD